MESQARQCLYFWVPSFKGAAENVIYIKILLNFIEVWSETWKIRMEKKRKWQKQRILLSVNTERLQNEEWRKNTLCFWKMLEESKTTLNTWYIYNWSSELICNTIYPYLFQTTCSRDVGFWKSDPLWSCDIVKSHITEYLYECPALASCGKS